MQTLTSRHWITYSSDRQLCYRPPIHAPVSFCTVPQVKANSSIVTFVITINGGILEVLILSGYGGGSNRFPITAICFTGSVVCCVLLQPPSA
jgi:hypothetical protein